MTSDLFARELDASPVSLRPDPRPFSSVVFSRQRDDWETPCEVFAALDAEFHFTADAAATASTTKCARYFGPDSSWLPDALRAVCPIGSYFLNPPYSQTRAFIAKAAEAAASGSTVVCLVAARTDTRWWHEHVYEGARWAYRPGVSVRFRRGRLRFVGASSSAPFPSVVVIFRLPVVELVESDAVLLVPDSPPRAKAVAQR